MWVPTGATPVFAQSVGLNQQSITAGDSVMATVNLNQPAPAGGAVVSLANILNGPVGTSNAIPFVVSMPSSVIVDEGMTSASFPVVTSVTSSFSAGSAYSVDIQASHGDTTQTASFKVNPPLALSTLSITPGNIVGGSTALGTVTLTGAAPAGGAVVALSSSSSSATVPPSVAVQSGQISATFTVQTDVVAAFTTVRITAACGSPIAATATASLIIAPPAAAVDTITITKADYVISKKQLVVQATSTSRTVVLTVSATDTGEVIGLLTNKGAGSYAGTFNLAAGPQSITVTSDLTGTATRAVTFK